MKKEYYKVDCGCVISSIQADKGYYWESLVQCTQHRRDKGSKTLRDIRPPELTSHDCVPIDKTEAAILMLGRRNG
jgi:hypothetical protein